jgi:hypothetical protein
VVPELTETVGLPVALGLGALLVVWYLAGNELMRRRSHRLALWSRRIIEPLGGSQSIRWLGGQAFRLEVDATAQAPFRSLHVTGLVEAWDVPIVWAWNRLHGRRDMVLLQASLRQQPVWGLEVYRTGTLLAGDARLFARQEGWAETALAEFTLAAGGDPPQKLAADLVGLLDAERARLTRLAVRRQGHHLTLALNVPDPGDFDPATVSGLATELAERIVSS